MKLLATRTYLYILKSVVSEKVVSGLDRDTQC